MLARLEQARHSKDIDVYFAEQSAAVSDATAALRTALGRDLGDFFGFEVTRIGPLQEEAKGSRVHVRATLGAKTFAVFHIDVVVGTAMSGEPDEVAPLTPLHVDGLVRPPYRAFPLPDHVADKFCTIEKIVADLLGDHEDESAVAQIVRDGIRDGLLGRDELARAAARYGVDHGYGSATEFVAVLAGRQD